jgi:hypothetical protein
VQNEDGETPTVEVHHQVGMKRASASSIDKQSIIDNNNELHKAKMKLLDLKM